MSVRVKFRWNEAEFKILTDVTTVPKAVRRAAGKVRDRAKVNVTTAGLVDTGALRNSITSKKMTGRPGSWYEVGSELKYAIWQHEGTTGPILPRRAKFLRFKSKSGALVFAKQVRGVKGTPFLTDALRETRPGDFLP